MKMDPLFEGDDDANTPITTEESEQLLLSYISLRSELNVAEQANIAEAILWLAKRRRRNVSDILDDAFLRELHRRMFGDVWRWAGKYRVTARNIGTDAYRIPSEMRLAIEDVRFWVENETFEPDEIAVRFSHRLVLIHPFPNGNGRFSRLAGDLLASYLGRPPFSWGQTSLVSASETRAAYISALRAADAQNFAPLIEFARS